MCTFVAPKFIEKYTNTKSQEEPRCCYHPVRSYKAYQQRGLIYYKNIRGDTTLLALYNAFDNVIMRDGGVFV
jgi:hypothetical protein